MFNKLNYLRNKYKSLTPQSFALHCVEIVDRMGKIIGITLASDCRVTIYSYTTLYLAVQHNAFSVYTAWYFWNENRISSLQPFTLFAIAVPVSKWYLIGLKIHFDDLLSVIHYKTRVLFIITINWEANYFAADHYLDF